MDRRTNGWIDVLVDGWTVGRMDRWTVGGWMDG